MSIESFKKTGIDCHIANNLYDSLAGAEAVVIMTEWQEFIDLDLGVLKSRMSGRTVYDFRNIISRTAAEEAGINLISVGA